jgi:hypothetical protein
MSRGSKKFNVTAAQTVMAKKTSLRPIALTRTSLRLGLEPSLYFSCKCKSTTPQSGTAYWLGCA